MTKQEKERRMKLIYLIIIVNTEYIKRSPFKNIIETITFANEQVFWTMELMRVASIKTFESGGLSIIGENKSEEIILTK